LFVDKMLFGWLIWLLLGVLSGVILSFWFFLGNYWGGDPTPDEIKETFTGQANPYLVRLVVGDAEICPMGEQNDTFVRLRVNSANNARLTLSQIDDYTHRPHGGYAWQPPLVAEAKIRFSATQSGSSGFFLWNNPVPLWAEAGDIRPINWIGFLRISDGATLKFHSGNADPRFRGTVVASTWLRMAGLYTGLPGLPKPYVDEVSLDSLDAGEWHIYTIEWRKESIRLLIDGNPVLESHIKIGTRLSLVLWVDNNQPTIDNQVTVAYEKMQDVRMDVAYVEIQPLVE
jgi:hypothetical protein